MESSKQSLFRLLPSIHEVLTQPGIACFTDSYPRDLVAIAAREALEALREEIRSGDCAEATLNLAVDRLAVTVEDRLRQVTRPRLRRVLNATGVMLQTNLGRAPLSASALEHVVEVARGYCNLEFDLEDGKRSRRDDLTERMILQVAFGDAQTHKDSMAAAVVNNCAAAMFLALNSLAEAGGEVIVSRGELVEIGGGFRVPEILAKSGAVLREVGTTNRTRIADYAAAISPHTRLILRVHRSNFSIEGFTEQPGLAELVELGRRAGIPVFEDQGTGCLADLGSFGLPGESSWLQSVRSGASLVAASGDKLLGGPQCGLLVGEAAVVRKLQANPLFRALRVDKLTYAALESTLAAYLAGRPREIPLLAMLHASAAEIRARCEAMQAALQTMEGSLQVEVRPVESVIGGGTTPGATLPSFAVALRSASAGETELARRLRRLEPPVIARVQQGWVLLDLRTVAPGDDEVLAAHLRALADFR